MKIIGKMADGSLLVRMEEDEVRGLVQAAVSMVESMGFPELAQANTPPPALPAPAAGPEPEPVSRRAKPLELPAKEKKHRRNRTDPSDRTDGARRATSRTDRPARAKHSREKTCVICEKNFTDKTNTNTMKSCGTTACKKALAIRAKDLRKAKIAGKRAKRKSWSPMKFGKGETEGKINLVPNPADPFASDEERKAARLEIIKRSAANHSEG